MAEGSNGAPYGRKTQHEPAVKEVCNVDLAEPHTHLVEPASRRLLCACDACALLFSSPGDARYRRVPRDIRFLDDIRLSDEAWESLQLPINLVFYPYRPSVKNRQRWTFGGLYPEACYRARADGSASTCQTECLVEGTDATIFEASVRFLHVTARQVAKLTTPCAEWIDDGRVPYRSVDSFWIGERLYQTWQEAEERSVPLGAVTLGDLQAMRCWAPFEFPGRRQVEPLRDPSGNIAGLLIREQRAIAGIIEATAVRVGDWLFRVNVRVLNTTAVPDATACDREESILRALISTHAVLNVRGGMFLSLLDPPAYAQRAAAECRNLGTWPVLLGDDGQADTMLSSPIVLYDYPKLAAESAGDFFDGTEIDEMLTLRIMTLTDEEKGAMAAVDERASALLARTESLAREQLLRLHGTVRGLREVSAENRHA